MIKFIDGHIIELSIMKNENVLLQKLNFEIIAHHLPID